MRLIVTNIARSVDCVSVCVGHTVTCAKTVERIEMLFGMQIRMGQGTMHAYYTVHGSKNQTPTTFSN